MDSWYKNKFEDLTKKTSRHVDRVRSIREEIAGAKKDVSVKSENEYVKTEEAIITKIMLKYLQIQSKERDLDVLRTRNDALEAQIREMQEKYKKELEDLQVNVD